MKVTVFGTRKYDFVDSRTDERKVGITAHYTCESNNADVKGLEYGKFGSAKDKPMYGILDNLTLPAQLNLEFNRYGGVVDFEVIGQCVMERVFKYITIYKAHWTAGVDCYSDTTISAALEDFLQKYPEECGDSLVIQVNL